MQARRGAREMQLLGNHDETAKMAKLHVSVSRFGQ